MDNIPTPLLIITLVGWMGIGVGGYRPPSCPTESAIDNCNTHMPHTSMAGHILLEAQTSLFVDFLRLSINEIKDMCRSKIPYEDLLVCISILKRDCWVDSEVKELFPQRELIRRIMNYICQNYSEWNFKCSNRHSSAEGICESDFVDRKTVYALNSISAINDHPKQYIHLQCLNVDAKEYCYPRTMENCGFKSLGYAKNILELSRPPPCLASQMTCPIIALVVFTWLSRLLSGG